MVRPIFPGMGYATLPHLYFLNCTRRYDAACTRRVWPFYDIYFFMTIAATICGVVFFFFCIRRTILPLGHIYTVYNVNAMTIDARRWRSLGAIIKTNRKKLLARIYICTSSSTIIVYIYTTTITRCCVGAGENRTNIS